MFAALGGREDRSKNCLSTFRQRERALVSRSLSLCATFEPRAQVLRHARPCASACTRGWGRERALRDPERGARTKEKRKETEEVCVRSSAVDTERSAGCFWQCIVVVACNEAGAVVEERAVERRARAGKRRPPHRDASAIGRRPRRCAVPFLLALPLAHSYNNNSNSSATMRPQ